MQYRAKRSVYHPTTTDERPFSTIITDLPLFTSVVVGYAAPEGTGE
jgi:hypothetical protein